MNQNFFTEIPIPSLTIVKAKLTPTKLVVPKSYSQWMKTERVTKQQMLNLRNDEFKLQNLSANSKRKLERKLDWLISATAKNCISQPLEDAYLKSNLAVITLTLSRAQYHGDKYIKREMLNRFLTALREEYTKLTYIWKAEIQENSNIHFHIVVNQFICFKRVRTIWNTIQSEHGYITITEDGLSCPMAPSTEVKGCQDKTNTKSYLMKYISKLENSRVIEGRLWSCSHDLSSADAIDLPLSTISLQAIEKLVREKKIYVCEWQYCFIYIGNWRLIERQDNTVTKGAINFHLNPFPEDCKGLKESWQDNID